MGGCPKCGGSNPPDARFCMSCGQPLGVACTRCGVGLPADARFCPACGTRVADAVAAAVDEETLKIVTVLFADVVGSTAQAEGMPPDEVRALMTDFFDTMSQEIRAQGGTVERIIGDAVMADFGVPVVHEDDPRRAVRAAMKMLARLEQWNAAREPRQRIEIRIGINTGEVSAAGSPGQELLVTGDAVNVAARLQEAAWPGTILIGARTAAAVREGFRLRAVEPLAVKGKGEPIRAFVVEAEAEQPERVERLKAPMVGRDKELRQLTDIFKHVCRKGAPRLVTIIGEAGVGKSRLAREFVASLSDEAKVVVGRCLPEGSGTTYWPLAEILKSAAGIFDTDAPDDAVGKIDALVHAHLSSEVVSDPGWMVTALAATLGLEGDQEPLSERDPREVKRDLIAAWRALFTALSAEAPLVVGIEDIYWADDTLLEVVGDLATHVRGPLLFLCLARPELSWGMDLRNYSALPLDPLPPEQEAELVSALVGTLPRGLSARVLEKTEGNPFFVEEVVQKLIDEGTIVRDHGQWKAVASGEDIEIPDNVHAVIAARLDLLDPNERQVARLASVIGRTFWPGAVAHLAQSDHLHDTLRSLERREIIQERLSSSMPGEPEYWFKHILIRNVAYDSLPRRRRGEAHAAVADWIQTKSGQRLEDLVEILAYHYDNAFELLGDEALRAQARTHCLEAALSALRRFAIHQADGFGRRAVQLSSEVERVEALEAMGDLHVLTGDGDTAWRSFNDALTELQRLDARDEKDVARVASKAAILATRWEPTMEHPASEEEVDRVIEMGLKAAGHTESPERSLLLASKSFLARVAYDEIETPERLAKESLEIARQLDDPELLSLAGDALAFALLPELRLIEIARLQQERVELIPRLSDTKEIRDIYGSAEWSAVFVGRYAEAETYGTLAVERARDIDPGDYLHALSWRAQARFMTGDWDGALDDVREVEQLERERQGTESSLALRAFGVAALCHELRGEDGKTDSYLDILRNNREKSADAGPSFAGLYVLGARALAHRNQPQLAREWLFLERSPYLGLNLEAACEVAPALQDWALAEELIALAEREIPEQEETSLINFILRLKGRMAAIRGDNDAARSLLHRSADGFIRLGAPWEQAWSNLLLAETLVELSAPKEAEKAVKEALETFRRLGSVSEAERSERLLAGLG